jgi:hypothetical protein
MRQIINWAKMVVSALGLEPKTYGSKACKKPCCRCRKIVLTSAYGLYVRRSGLMPFNLMIDNGHAIQLIFLRIFDYEFP